MILEITEKHHQQGTTYSDTGVAGTTYYNNMYRSKDVFIEHPYIKGAWVLVTQVTLNSIGLDVTNWELAIEGEDEYNPCTAQEWKTWETVPVLWIEQLQQQYDQDHWSWSYK